MCQTGDSIFDVRFPTYQFCPSKCEITRPPNFRKFQQTAQECCNRNICGTCCKLLRIVKSNFDRHNKYTILLLYVCQISDSIFDVRFPTCQFYPSKCDITRPPIFGSFCKLLRNVVTETFAEPSENLEVSSNRILTGGPSLSFLMSN